MGLKIGNNSANLERDCDHAPADFGVLFCFFGQPHPDQSILSEKEDWASVSQNRILHQQTKMVIQHDTIQEHPNASLWISWKTPIVEFWTKTDSETTPDSETRDSETISSDSENKRGIQKLFCGIQKLFRRIQKLLVVFRNYFVVFRNYS